jgi:hypothetical protein
VLPSDSDDSGDEDFVDSDNDIRISTNNLRVRS